MSAFAAFNLGLRFLLELGALAALGYWGAQAGGDTIALAVAFAAAAVANSALVRLAAR